MQFTTTALSLLAALPLVYANGCYSGGNTFSDYGNTDDLAAARTAACQVGNLAGNYTAKESKTYCAQNGGSHISFATKSNVKTGTLTLSTSDCLAYMTTEMNACEHGSEQDHASFHYTADPNDGAAC